MKSATNLRVIGLDDTDQMPDVRAPEDMLGFLFAREHQLQRELAEVRRQLSIHRERYAAKHDLMALPRVELLRTRFGRQLETSK